MLSVQIKSDWRGGEETLSPGRSLNRQSKPEKSSRRSLKNLPYLIAFSSQFQNRPGRNFGNQLNFKENPDLLSHSCFVDESLLEAGTVSRSRQTFVLSQQARTYVVSRIQAVLSPLARRHYRSCYPAVRSWISPTVESEVCSEPGADGASRDPANAGSR